MLKLYVKFFYVMGKGHVRWAILCMDWTCLFFCGQNVKCPKFDKEI